MRLFTCHTAAKPTTSAGGDRKEKPTRVINIVVWTYANHSREFSIGKETIVSSDSEADQHPQKEEEMAFLFKVSAVLESWRPAAVRWRRHGGKSVVTVWGGKTQQWVDM